MIPFADCKYVYKIYDMFILIKKGTTVYDLMACATSLDFIGPPILGKSIK